MTSGFFAGDEALRDQATNERLHEQQSPIALLIRIILVSSRINDTVLDPFAGTGTTAIVAKQLGRKSIVMENSKKNCDLIKTRLELRRKIDDVERYRDYYRYTENLDEIWKTNGKITSLTRYL